MKITRKMSAVGTIAAAAGTFALCGWAWVDAEAENQRVVEQAAARYDPPPIMNYITADPDDVWTGGGTNYGTPTNRHTVRLDRVDNHALATSA